MIEVTLLGCGGSAGVPMIGGADGRGDWGACDPAEPRNRRFRSSLLIRDPGGARDPGEARDPGGTRDPGGAGGPGEAPEGEAGRAGTGSAPDGGECLLVDTGPDLREQLLACGVPRVDAILYTHAHADHILGLDDVRILNRIAGRPLDAFGTPETLEDLERRFDYAFRPWRPPGFYRPVLVPRPVQPGAVVQTCGLALQLFEQDHKVLKTLGLRVGGFGYSTDVVGLDEAAFAALQGVEVWMVDCFQRGRHVTHAHLELALAWAERVGARRTVLTHMGTDMDWAWLRRHLPPGVEPGHDGMVLQV